MTTRHTILVLGMVCLIAFMIMPSIPAMAKEKACDSLEKENGSGNGKKNGNDKAKNNNDCEETSSTSGGESSSSKGGKKSSSSKGGGKSSSSTSGGESPGSCDMNSDGVITAAELLAYTGTSIDWQAVIDSTEASLSGTSTNNNGLIDTPAEFGELYRIVGC